MDTVSEMLYARWDEITVMGDGRAQSWCWAVRREAEMRDGGTGPDTLVARAPRVWPVVDLVPANRSLVACHPQCLCPCYLLRMLRDYPTRGCIATARARKGASRATSCQPPTTLLPQQRMSSLHPPFHPPPLRPPRPPLHPPTSSSRGPSPSHRRSPKTPQRPTPQPCPSVGQPWPPFVRNDGRRLAHSVAFQIKLHLLELAEAKKHG